MIKIAWSSDVHMNSVAVASPETPTIAGPRYLHTSKQALNQYVDYVNDNVFDLAVCTGDLVEDEDGMVDFMEHWVNIKSSVRSELVIGNHEISLGKAALATGLGYGDSAEIAGSKFNQSFEITENGVSALILMVDSSQYDPLRSAYTGYCPEDVRTWIAGVLAASTTTNVLLFMHHSPKQYDFETVDGPVFDPDDAIALDAVFQADLVTNPTRKIKVFAGHDHGYGDVIEKTKAGFGEEWDCYINRKAIVDYAPGISGNGGFAIIKLTANGNITFELIDKIFPYTS